jgi:acetyltransferase
VRSHPLDALFAPGRVAIIGASEVLGSVGRAVIENLRGFSGPIFFVTPDHPQILETKTFPGIGSVPECVDLAVIATPARTVPGIIRECAHAGVGGAVIISAGFKECGKAGAELEQEILAEARRGKLRLIGPNCLGIMVPRSSLNATFAERLAKPGNVAFLSQSGALCTALLDWSLRENVGFSAFVSVGSMLDVGWGDLITFFGDDPHTKSIVIYMESVGDARSFLSAAREVALTKPIIVLKVGRTEAGGKAAASHTGALTGSDAVLDAAFRRAGVLRVNSIEDLFDMAEVLAKQPLPRGPRLAIVTNAGGPGALAADALVTAGGRLADLSEATRASLDALLPAHWSHGNPIDILGDASPERYARATALAAQDPDADGVLVILTPQAMTDPTATARQLTRLERGEAKPLFGSWMGGPAVDSGEGILNSANIPTFKYPDRAARAFDDMWRYSLNLRALYETPALPPASSAAKTRHAEGHEIIQSVRKSGRVLLTEVESKQILAAYGIPTVATQIARTEDEAAACARELGYPVVLKLFSETLTHKSGVGGVHLDLRDAKAARHAWRAIEASVRERAGPQHFLGVTVQPMIQHDGYELILGGSVDPQFGPVLLFGAGGQLVEVLKDSAVGLPPLNGTLARRLMEQTRIFNALRGTSGRRPVDLNALEHILVRFSQLVAEEHRIKEIDVNPLMVSADRLLALDARVVLHPSETREDHLPRPAIRPYPTHYISTWTLKNGESVTIRPIRPEDEEAMVRFHGTLSDRSVYLRYFTPLRLEQRIAHERLSRICFIDYDREIALVAERCNPASGRSEIMGVGRLSRLHGVNAAEFALVLSDEWQGKGIGTALLKKLVQIGRDEKLERITATILPANRPMQRVARKAGFTLEHSQGDCRAEILL